MFRKVLMCLLVFGSTAAYADSGPTPPKSANDIQCLVGEWKGSGNLEMGPNKVPVKITYRCEKSVEGFGVACNGSITGIPGMASYNQQDLWGYDAGDNSVHWFTITNAGETHDHKGKLGADRWDGKYVGKRDGKEFVEKISFVFANKNTISVQSEGLVAGKRVEFLRMTMERKHGRNASR